MHKLINKLDNFDISKFEGKLHSFLNPYSFMVLKNNIDIIEGFDSFYGDGILLCKSVSYLRGTKLHRFSFDFTSIANNVFEYSVTNKRSIYFCGGSEPEIVKFTKRLKSRYNGLIIKSSDGFESVTDGSVFSDIIKENPDIVISSLGTPLQEYFLLKLREYGWKGTGFTCGGFVRQYSDTDNYFPSWADRLNLRWLVRAVREPHVIPRFIKVYPKFFGFILYQKLKRI